MNRRDVAKKIALAVGGTIAGATIMPAIGAQKRESIAALYTSPDLHDTVNVLQFGTMDDASTAFYLAFIYLNKRGGGNLLVPNGNYDFKKTVKTRIGCKISIYTSSNSILTMSSNADMFDIIGSSNAALRFFGNGEFIYGGPETENAACIRFLSLSENKKYASSSFECNGRLRFRKGQNEWRYAIHLTDVRDAVLSGPQFDGLNSPGNPSKQYGIYAQAKNNASVSWVISNLQFNDVNTGFYADSDVAPGIEGLKFFNCDMAGVKHGIVYNNNTSYYPPQIELIGCHINGYGTLISIKKAISIHIIGGLYYRKGQDGVFIELNNVQDVSIVGASLSITGKESDIPGILITDGDGISGLIRISDCHYWANEKKSPFIVVSGKLNLLTLSNSTKDSKGKWIDMEKMESNRSTISVDRNTIFLSMEDKGELWGGVVDISNKVLDLRNSFPGLVYINGGDTIGKIIGGKINEEYIIISDIPISLVNGVNITNGGLLSKKEKVIKLIYDGSNFTII